MVGEVQCDFTRRYYPSQIDFDPPFFEVVVWVGGPVGSLNSVDEIEGVTGVRADFADAAALEVGGVGDGVDIAADEGGFELSAHDSYCIARDLPFAPVARSGDAELVGSERCD